MQLRDGILKSILIWLHISCKVKNLIGLHSGPAIQDKNSRKNKAAAGRHAARKKKVREQDEYTQDKRLLQ